MRKLPPIAKLTLFTISLMLILLSFRLAWLNYYQVESHPPAEDGYIDLEHADFSENKLYSLEGEWDFYPDLFIDPENISPSTYSAKVPGNWPGDLLHHDQAMFGQSSYYIELSLPHTYSGDMGIRFYEIFSAADIYVNGLLVHTHNDLHHSQDTRGFDRGPVDIFFASPESDSVEIVIHASNFNFPAQGGIMRDVVISSGDKIHSISFFSKGLQLSIGFILILHAIYSLALYTVQKKRVNNLSLTFSLMLFLFAAGVFMDDEVIINLPLSITENNRLLVLIFVSTLFIMLKIISDLFHVSKWKKRTAAITYIILSILIVFFPMEYFAYLVRYILSLYPIVIGIMMFYTVRSILKGNNDSYFILAFLLSYSSNAVWGAFLKAGIVQFPFYPYDFLFSMLALSGLLLKQHFDISKENQLQADVIIKNEKRKDEFLANTAHELRNPLHGIMTINETLIKNLSRKSPHSMQKDLLLNQKIALQMKYNLDDLRDYTLLKEDRLRIDQEAVHIEAVITTIIDILHYQTKGKNVRFETDLPETLPDALGDEQRLFQVFYNLLHNALKYTSYGKIHISASSVQNTMSITVSDTGSGIEKKDLERILKPYEQGDDSNKGGMGLGLSISRELILLHNGEFSIDSIIGQGTSVRITLPIASEKPAQRDSFVPVDLNETALKNTVEMPHHHKAKVLMVDDDPMNLEILEKALQNEFHIIKAYSGEEGLAKLTRQSVELVITDVMMPEMSGYEFTEKIRQHYDLTELPVLHLTARQHTGDIIAGLNSGANDYVSKPIELDELLSRVRTLVNMKQAGQKKIETEAAWLQAQIKPHFLYNTMNAIASLSQTDPDRMVELLYEFGSYLKNSFHHPHGTGLNSLSEELEIVKPYLYIEQTRFPEKLEVIYDIHDADAILIPRLVLQTLVENAVNHGALAAKGKGIVKIQSCINETEAVIFISDNGPGDPTELHHSVQEQKTDGIGLINSHVRIKALNQKGLVFQNNEFGGVSIHIYLPRPDNYSKN